MLGIGIIGGGVVFEMHARGLESVKQHARLVGLAEVDDAKRQATTDRYFVPLGCADYQDLIARADIDVVVVGTPPMLHEEMVIAALEAGKHVICEKPLAHTLASADRIMDVAGRFAGKLSTVYQLRYLPEIQKILHLRDEGLLGRLLVGNCMRYAGHRLSSRTTSWWGQWERAGGGVVMTQFIHHLDQMYYIFGQPVEVTARMDTLQEDIESEDCFAAIIRFESGAIVNCGATICAQKYGFGIDVVASEASVHYPWALKCADAGKLRELGDALRRAFPGSTKPASKSLPAKALRKIRRKLGLGGNVGSPNNHATYLEVVLKAIAAGEPMPIPPAEARVSLELCMAIYTSAITGQSVRLPLEATSPFYNGVTIDDYRKLIEPDAM